MRNRLIKSEYLFYKQHPRNMRILLMTNLLYALVLPILELFVGAYILRQTNNTSYVVIYQLAVYTGIPFTFLINGYLLRYIKIARLYSLGMVMSGVAMTIMMLLPELKLAGIAVVGLTMGVSYGFFWCNRDFLAISSTDDSNRNYYFSLETVFYTITFIIMPALAGLFISLGELKGLYPPRFAYITLTALVFLLTIIASIMVHQGSFENPERERFVFFKWRPEWYKMIWLGSFKGIAQAAIFFYPILLILTFIGNEGSLGGIIAVSSLITTALLYFIGRFSKPEHRIYVFGAGLLLYLIGGTFNTILFSAAGVLLYQMCGSLARPLLDAAYFPIQMNVIDKLSEIEKRGKVAYIFNHEFGLFFGRLAGCLVFLITARVFSPEAALRYSLLLIAAIQALSIPIAMKLIKRMKVIQE
jgi:MFS transporter, YQGE family, putative transporter